MPQATHGVSQTELDRLNARVRADPDIQRILQAEQAKLAQTRDRGGVARDYQNGIRDLVTHIARQKGLIPHDKYWVNPNDGNLEPSRGWSGLAGWQKALAIGGVAAATVATAGAFGVGLGAATAGGSAASAGSAAGGAGAAGAGGGAIGAVGATGVAGGLGGTLLRYGLQYGIPVAGSLIAGKMASNAERESNRALMDYYDRALEAERENQQYERGFREEDRRYGRYADQYGRLSDEEQLAYGRAEDIRDKNYGYQQYGNFVETLEPFRASGSAATSRMSQLLGGPAVPDRGSYLTLANTARGAVRDVPSVPGRPTWNYEGAAAPVRPDPNEPVNRIPTQPGAPVEVIRVQAPDGEIRDLPATAAQRAIALGAKRIGS